MLSSESSPPQADYALETSNLIASLEPDREAVASEVAALQSIYGDDNLRPWASDPNHNSQNGGTQESVRYEVCTNLPAPHDQVPIRILVTIPPSYPLTSPPQLQLLSKYIGAFGVNSSLFGSVLRIFHSTNGVEWSPDSVCVFDGVEKVLELCASWYADQLSLEKAGELLREDEKAHRTDPQPDEDEHPPYIGHTPFSMADDATLHLPEDLQMYEAEPITDRKSAFVGRACKLDDPAHVPEILRKLLSDRKIARAAHPVINAWRCRTNGVLHQDNDDDGETAAGGRLAHLLQILEVDNVLVIVTRYFGGIHLGPDRFKLHGTRWKVAVFWKKVAEKLSGAESGRITDVVISRVPLLPSLSDDEVAYICPLCVFSTPITKDESPGQRSAARQSGKHEHSDNSLIKQQGYINGNWLDAASGATIKVTNPANGDELGTIPEMGLQETKQAIEAAGKAFETWSTTTAKYRHDLMKKLFSLMQEHNEDLGRIMTLENGKPLVEGKAENQYSASFIEWFAEEAVRTYGKNIPSPFPHIRNVTIKQPVGVCSILTPWNFPSAMITRKLGAALAAGCTVVIKPPPETPFSALALTELARRAGFPDGVINVVTTQANVAEVGKEMCENKIVKKVSFTGSTPVAKLLYGIAASTLKKVSIEAGGNAPFIVFNDADVDAAVDGAIASKFRGSGQTCVCANRIYVQSSVYAEFASRLSEKVSAFKVGNGLDKDTTHGPLIHGRAIEKVKRHVDDAVQRGASVLVGGKHIDGNFYAPTVLCDVPRDAEIMDEETFGPVAALVKFETEEEVIRLANDTPVGLAGYLYSRDVGRVWRVSEALQVGMIGANTGLISQAPIPFGGVKESGLGREGGPSGIDEYMITKFIAMAL
ncbi:succinic semialdehyde dehydrogenase [Sistotremastrum suecicum HHB10207 ss-3]|uniref:succinate-semialdehyde dehydrogenase [NAD(P)(+)] n=1 Tax=Sistotremastrum suecicum HHB10207 ss-3 TaxID=1314776 RepID=A0A166HQ07_9AGAM|nr:succinic semialdehyde dehydrogenase [Sistotremastrum suecicum HHB10207 ss-3]